MTLERAMRMALAKAGSRALGVPVNAGDLAEATMTVEDLCQDLPQQALFLRLESDGLACGLAVACPQVVGAVIEAQTIGNVLKSEAAERKPTRTDASLVAGFVDECLGNFSELSKACEAPPPVAGFRAGEALADARAAEMVLADTEHLRLEVGLDFAGGAKTGKLVLVFPLVAKMSNAAPEKDWKATLSHSVLGSTVQLDAQLCRLRMPLSDIADLQVGSILKLGQADLDGVSLVGSDGSRMIKARLGRSGHVRAVRLVLSGAVRAPPLMDAGGLVAKAAPQGDVAEGGVKNGNTPTEIGQAASEGERATALEPPEPVMSDAG